MYPWGEPPRQESQIVKSGQQVQDDYNTWLSDWNKSLTALQQTEVPTREQYAYDTAYNHDFGSFFADQAKYDPIWNTKGQQDWYRGQYANDVSPSLLAGGSPSDQSYLSQNGDLASIASYDPNVRSEQISGQIAQMMQQKAEKDAEFDAFKSNERRQQQAFNQQTGGGFAGGLIDASYSDPFSSQISGASTVGGLGGLGGMPVDPSMPNVAMPWAQPWGTPGFGQPGQGSSQGVGSYNPAGAGSAPQQGGWGGPFGNRNPWSFA